MSTILGPVGTTAIPPSLMAMALPDSAGAPSASPGDTVDLSPAATQAAHDDQAGATPDRVAAETAVSATGGLRGVAAEARDATRIPTEAELRRLVGSSNHTGAAAIKQAAKPGAPVSKLLRSVPADATATRFEPTPDATIKDGISFKWEEMVDGKPTKHMFEVHGPDMASHAGPNSSSGNVARLRQTGNKYLDPGSGEMVKMGKNTPEALANSTHIPLRGNLQTPYGRATQAALEAERGLGRVMVPVAVGMDAYHLYSTPKEERPREAAGVLGSWAGAVALAKPCAVGGAMVAGVPGAIVGGLACGAIGGFAGGAAGRWLYDKMH